MTAIFTELEEIFTNGIAHEYLGEAVSVVEHSLQCADLAADSAAPSSLILAALLHDIGHLLISDSARAYEMDLDRMHDEIGASWIAERFPESVVEPVRLHVAAKRYLVSTDMGYMAKLSEASIRTLELQGGKMNAREVADFESNPYWRDSIQVRLWDDAGKVAGKKCSSLNSFRHIVESLFIR